ncbi:MAG: leucine-rich repeat protein, partial [Bacteroidales bacterium]|nr:leucine-rich repeat protein [Bacteroidales bacterium]
MYRFTNFKAWGITLFVFLSFNFQNAKAQHTLLDNEVVVTNGIITSCSYLSYTVTDIIIPETLDGQTVIGIANGASAGLGVFYRKEYTSVQLPSTIEMIGDYAFYYNKISNLDLSNCTNLTSIGKTAFGYNRLTSINLSGCGLLETIGMDAFGSNSIASVNLEGLTLLTSIGNNAFYTNSITSVNLSGCSALKTIGDYAFDKNNINNLDLTACTSLSSVARMAFYGNSLTSLDLSDCTALTFIGALAFYSSTLSSFELPQVTGLEAYGWNGSDGSTFTGGATVSNLEIFYWVPVPYTLTDDDVVVTNGEIISCSYDFSSTDIIIPQTLDAQTVSGIAGEESSASWVFYNKGITSIQLPSTLETIGRYAFYNNTSMVNIDFSSCTALTTIGDGAFSYNQYLNGVNLSGCVALTNIGERAFASNISKSVNFTGCISLDTIGDYAFENNDITELDLSECTSLKYIGESSFYENSITNLNLANCTALTTIGGNSFNSNSITSLDFSDCSALSSVGYAAFSENALTSINFSGCSSLVTIGDQAFFLNAISSVNFTGCTALSNIMSSAFSNNSLAQLDLTACTGLSIIGYTAFYANALTSIDLSNCSNLKLIEEYAFYQNQLSGFSLPIVSGFESNGWRDGKGNIYTGGDIINDFETFYEVPIPYTLTDNDVVVTNGILESCSYNFEIKDIIIPDTLDGQKIIGIADASSSNTGIFYNKGLTSVKLPLSLETIGNYTFFQNAIYTIDLTNFSALKSIGKNAFEDNNLSGLILTGCISLTEIGDMAFQGNLIAGLDFSDCTNLTTINYSAFYHNKLGSVDFSNCTKLQFIGQSAFSYNSISGIDLSECTSLTYIGKDAFNSNNFSNFNLPVVTQYETLGWRDEYGNKYAGGENAGSLSSFYMVPIPYVLTNDDVVVNAGIIESCSYDYARIDIIIPDTLDGQLVKGIASSVNLSSGIFSMKGIASIQFPASLESIGNYAFFQNQLYELDLTFCPDLNTIGIQAFNYNGSLESLNLSACTKIVSISNYAFANCALDTIDLNACTAISSIGDYAFYNNSISHLAISGCTALMSIGNYAFSGNSITSFILPIINGYEEFGWKDGSNNRFIGGSSVTNLNTYYVVALPYTLTDNDVVLTNGEITFCSYNFANTDIIIPDTLDGQVVKGIANAATATEGVFYNKGISWLQLPSSIQYIGEYSFCLNSTLETLDLSRCSALLRINQQAFTGDGLSEIDLSNCTELNYIGYGAFYGNSLIGINLTNCHKLTYIASRAFYLNSFSSFVLPVITGFEAYGWKDGNNHSFIGGQTVSDLNTYYVAPIPYTLTDDDVVVINGMIESCSYDFSHTDIIIPDTLDGQKVIGIINGSNESTGVFNNSPLTSIKLPVTFEVIGNYAFANNYVLTGNLDLSNFSSLTTIGDHAFDGSTFTGIDFSNCISLVYIGKEAFNSSVFPDLDLSDCTALTTIGEYAFIENQITSLDLSQCNNLSLIGEGAFYLNPLSDFTLPITSNYLTYWWTDGNGNVYEGGASATDLTTEYTLSVPYTLSDDDVVVEDGIIISCSYDFSQTNIIIPDTLDGQTIIGIAKGTWQNAVFYNKGISTLQLPSYIQTIGDYSFSDNSIFNIDFSKCTELDSIGNSAFVNNQIDSLDLSTCASLIYIGEEAFSENLLTSINLNGCTLLNTIDEYAFHNNLLTSVDLTFCVSLSSLEYGVFSDNELTSLKINGLTTLTSIGEYCFAYNSLTSVDLSGCTNLTSIGRMAFYDNYTISSLDLTNCTFLSFIGDEAFYENSLAAINLTPCTALTFIGNNAFGYNQLTEFTLPTVTGLEIYGWRDGDGNRYTGGETITNFDTYYQVPLPYTLTDDDVVVANGIIVSCSYNFERTDIIIPDTLDGQMVTEIRDTLNNYGIFREKGITSLQLPSTLQKIGDYSFYGNSITSLDLSICPGLISIGDQAFVYYDDYHNWNPITELNLNACNSLTTIGYGAFNSQKITNLDLSDCSSLTLIEDYAFQWCPITNLNVSGCSALTRIGKYAFRDTEIENLDLTGCTSLASIGEYAFAYVTPMTSLDLSDCSSLTSIENRAFFGTTLASGFVLPTPEIPGFNLDYWLDGTAVQHAGGETVSNTNTSYSAVLTRAILITFNVSDGINPLQGITINLDGFGEKNTDNSGVARFTAATKDSISYTASAPGYITVNDSVSAIDTVVTENVVMVLCNDSIAIFDTICDGDMVLYNDSTCTENGQYVFIFPNRFGCDSVITLNLTVNPSESIVFDSTICEGDSFNIGDSVYSENGTYINKYPNRYGCDSTVTLHLTVLPSQAVERSEVICEGSNIQIGDSIYIKSGTFITELINQYGCDSIVTLHLTVNPVDSTFLTEIICEGEQIIVGDSVYTQTGFFSNILVNQNGCDSTIVLNLTVNPVHQLEQNSEICEGEFITIGDSTYNKTGTFITNLTNQYGCDSTITLNLTVNRIDTTNLAETICEGDTIFLGDQPFTQSGIFLKTFSNQFGCDSVVHLNLNILPKFVTVQDLICEGDSVNIGPKFYSATGVYTDTLNNFLGCDSIVTLQLTVLPKETMLEKTVCHGELVPFGDSVYTETGIYIDSLQNVLGCDSIVFLDLVANRVDSIKREEIICQGESVQIGDSVYSSSGYFTINFLNQYGCDSVITLNLTVNPTHKFISDAEICEGEEYLFQGNYYDVQGNYSDTFTNQYGCDSIYMLNLVVHPSNRIVFRDTVTYGDSYSFRGTDYTSGGLYSDTLNNQFGCDSIISLLLYVYYEPIVDIPDSLFKAELLNDTLINTNHDDEIQVAEAVAYTGLVQVEGKNIQSFIGIEAFKNIDSLWCANNLADSLDLSTNTKLVYVDCSDNNIEFLDIDHLILLTKLDISGNELNGVQLNENTELEILNCSNNQLNSLDLSISNKLNELNCSDNALTELNLRNGNNINLSVLATGNTGLNCVTVDNTDWANANWESFFDAGILFSTDCNAPDIAINSIGFIPGDVYPGDEITISWKVMNYGNAAAVGGWNERISLISPSNQKLYLNGNLVYAYTLAATDTVLRSAKLEIPALTSFSGPAYVMVELIPTGSLVNEESVLVNNKQVSDSTLILHDLLGFSILESSAFENYSGTLRGTVSRSGNSDTTLTVNLITSGSDLSIPASVKITTGNNATNFYFTLNNNDLFDGIRLVEVVASADGLDPVSDKIEILDDDIPNLSITIDRDSCSEGEIIYATVRSEIKLDTTQTILISASKSGQVGFNSTLTIPANDSSVQVEITITDDSKPELDQSLILTASASGFISGKDTIILLDNDIPEIELVVVTDTLCESAGDNATWLKVTRNKDNAETITVALSTFNSNEVVVPEYIHFFPGDMEELAAIDVIDNEQVDGYRTVSVTGAIYIPTCNCISNTTGKDTTQIVLADDDGPALKLSCSPITLSEGQINQGTLNITRNASNSMTLLVHLTTNNPGELLLQDTVTIPAGSSSVDVPVMALNDSIDDGQQTVTIKAGADNYSPGTVTVYTSDQSKPDLSVGSFAIAHSQIQTKEQLEFTASVLNTGQLKAPSGITLDLYLSKNDKLDNLDLHLQQFTTNEVIPIGGAISIWELVSMPSNVGSYYLILRVNNNQNVTELLYLNNNSQALSIELQANFNAMASVAEETFISAEPILITGSAVLSDSTPAINKEVEIYVITQGIRRSLSATTDGEGKFSVTFEPGSNEVGHYIIGVCYPGANLQTAQDEFDIMGFGRTSASWLTWYLHKGETINGSFTVKNFSNAELTGLKLNFPQKPAGFEIQVNTISVLEGNQTASFNFSLTGSVVSPGLDYIKIPVIISSDQGVKFEFTALYYCQALEGLLKTEPISLNSSFTKDKIRYVEFIVYNSGAGN